MIGLGSNRLTVCRRGGMSVTQAGKGGMEWLAGGRMPSWATPYSAQATAALKDAFTAAQWVTIRDYGFSHPEIVGYMNAYAPEDAKIAYSLVAGLGVRYLRGDGTAYINIGLKATGNMVISCLTIDGFYSSSYAVLFGASGGGYTSLNTEAWNYGSNTDRNWGSGARTGKLFVANKGTLSVDGTVVQTWNQQTFTTSVNMFLYADNNGSARRISKAGIRDFNIVREGSELIHYAPFQLGVAREAAQCYPNKACGIGEKGMIDLLTGIFYPNANSSGSFTISETPAS